MTVRFERAPIRWGLLPLVVFGGAIGALVRGLLTLPFDPPDASVSGLVMLLSVNTLGSALLGVVNGAIGDRARLRAFLGTGMLGGFTSYSALTPLLGAWPLGAASDPFRGGIRRTDRVDRADRTAGRRSARRSAARPPDLPRTGRPGMTVWAIVAVAVGGGIGAGVRWSIDQSLWTPRGFPWAIMLVNVTGCFAMALVHALVEPVAPFAAVAAAGFLGGYTTFSTVNADIGAAVVGRPTRQRHREHQQYVLAPR